MSSHLAVPPSIRPLIFLLFFLLTACTGATVSPGAANTTLDPGQTAVAAAPAGDETTATPTSQASPVPTGTVPPVEVRPEATESTSSTPPGEVDSLEAEPDPNAFLRDKIVNGDGLWPFVPLDDPVFIPAADSDLAPRELVLGISLYGQNKAYPTRMMWFHHVANDTLGGRPIAVTY